MKRWIALALGVAVAAAVVHARLRHVPAARARQPIESIDAASHARLEEVLRKKGAGAHEP